MLTTHSRNGFEDYWNPCHGIVTRSKHMGYNFPKIKIFCITSRMNKKDCAFLRLCIKKSSRSPMMTIVIAVFTVLQTDCSIFIPLAMCTFFASVHQTLPRLFEKPNNKTQTLWKPEANYVSFASFSYSNLRFYCGATTNSYW